MGVRVVLRTGQQYDIAEGATFGRESVEASVTEGRVEQTSVVGGDCMFILDDGGEVVAAVPVDALAFIQVIDVGGTIAAQIVESHARQESRL